MNNNKRMNENELTILVNNEIEWHKKMWKKLESVEDIQNTTDRRVLKLEIKNAIYGSTFGLAFGLLGSYLFKQF